MQPPLTIVAEMEDGTCLVEHVATFAAFIAVVLPFRRDPDCLRVTWHTTPAAIRYWPDWLIPAEVA